MVVFTVPVMWGVIAALTGYTTSAIVALAPAARVQADNAAWLSWIPILAWLAHGAALLASFSQQPPRFGLFDALSLSAFLMIALLLIGRSVRPHAAGAAVIYPIAVVCLVLQLFADAFPARALNELDWRYTLHIALSLLAYACLMLATIQALLLAAAERALHRRVIERMPNEGMSLASMETRMFALIEIGVGLLTLAILSGLFFVKDIIEQHLTHKLVFSLAAWAVFVILLVGRRRYGWRAQTAVTWTIVGMTALLLAYFGSKLVLEIILERGL